VIGTGLMLLSFFGIPNMRCATSPSPPDDGGEIQSMADILGTFDQDDQKLTVLFVDEIFFGHQGYEQPPQGLVIDNYRYRSSNFSAFEYRKKYIFRPGSGSCLVPGIHNISYGRFMPAMLPHKMLRINHYTVKSYDHWRADHIKRCNPQFPSVDALGLGFGRPLE
jgi:hypothetical protein